jgi:hypothetical protein
MLLLIVPFAACGGGESEGGSDRIPDADVVQAAEAGIQAAQARDACELLDLEELEAIFGEDLVERPERYPDWSSCEYFTAADDFFRMAFSVHFEGGREGWEIELAARGAAEPLIEQQEGIEVDSIVRPGYVSGLGDAAHFNSLLPSQILIGDTLIQFLMPLMPEPERHFRPLGERVIRKLRGG